MFPKNQRGRVEETETDLQTDFTWITVIQRCEVGCFLNDKNVVTVTYKVFRDRQDAKEVCLQLINTDIALFARSF